MIIHLFLFSVEGQIKIIGAKEERRPKIKIILDENKVGGGERKKEGSSQNKKRA